jgi:5-methylcytosine-specific restriction endonuclease McrA
MKSPKRRIKDKLEKLVKGMVKQRDKNTCQKCNKVVEGANCHASHVIPVSRDGRLAFDPINLKVLCFHCHINWWHKHPTESGKWYESKFPDRLEYLNKKHQENRTLGSITLNWYKEHYENLCNDIDHTKI